MSEPSASRPHIASPAYGKPRDDAALLPWSHALERLEAARSYWLATASEDGEPHTMPVDGLWLDGRLYFGGAPETRWSRNLTTNPRVAVHLESTKSVVILKGEAVRIVKPDADLARRLADATEAKYGFRPPDSSGPLWVLQPRTAFAWTDFTVDRTRWRFTET